MREKRENYITEKRGYGVLHNVYLTLPEYESFCELVINAADKLDKFSAYKRNSGRRYLSDYEKLLQIARQDNCLRSMSYNNDRRRSERTISRADYDTLRAAEGIIIKDALCYHSISIGLITTRGTLEAINDYCSTHTA